MERSGFRAAIDGRDPNKDVFDVRFGVLDKHVEVAVLGKNSGIEQFEFRLAAAASAVLIDKKLVGEFGLWIFVEHPHVAVRGSGVKVEVALFHVLPMIALISGQPE